MSARTVALQMIADAGEMLREDGDAIAEAERRLSDLREAAEYFVEIVDKAGLLNLSNGVQLGATSWFVKASESLESLRREIEQAGR